jgi:hypothetical protein
MIILRNEILFSDIEEIIYKTINSEELLYGFFSSKRGEIVEPSFLHIFEFDDDSTVVIDQQEKYWELDWNGIVTPISKEKKEWYGTSLLKIAAVTVGEMKK